MGYLNKDVVTVDAILTKRGRELLSQGKSAFAITKFAISDDEIDYGLYNPAHPLGTEFYGSAIENMPIVEASTNDALSLRYKLVTLERAFISQINVVPTLSVGGIEVISLRFGIDNNGTIITPSTSVGTSGQSLDTTSGYTAILYDSSIATLQVQNPIPNLADATLVATSDDVQVARGFSFKIAPKSVTSAKTTSLVITGNESGATISIPVTINPQTAS
jgi:hypothetical protein